MHFPLHPETPAEGQSLEDLFAGRGFDIEAMNARLEGLAEAEGLAYSRRTHTYNSRLAQELGAWAETSQEAKRFTMRCSKRISSMARTSAMSISGRIGRISRT